mmetsp:Transcript_14490/g.33727  ORF Transcript_14490/g.33727 Transcript_14490/m.33727 type:complete len:362 (-) Transcript_14490:35-1120(-)
MIPLRYLSFLSPIVTLVLVPFATALAAQKTRVAVLGATGNLGHQVIKKFLNQDIPVRCLIRSSSLEKIPEEFKDSPLFEVIAGDLLAGSSRSGDGIYRDDLVAPSAELLKCIEGCHGVVSCYGATRRTKVSDIFRNPEDTDPTHAKQINYRSMIALVAACSAVNNEDGTSMIKHIVRITGKGEDPKNFFAILINGLGSFAKAWNYEGEVVLRTILANSNHGDDDGSIGYTIVRPGVMKEEDYAKDNLILADDGGNSLKVTPVGYSQIAGLVVDLLLSAGDGRISKSTQNNKVTLAAMNCSDNESKSTLSEKIAALRNDRREFPTSLVAEHKAAVKLFFAKFAAFLSIIGISLATLVYRVSF